MAREKLESTTVEDLEQIFKKYGHKPQIAHGLAVAARTVWIPNPRVKVEFLLTFLDQEYDMDPPYIFPLAGEIYAEVVRQLLEADSSFGLSGEQLQQLVDFLGQRPSTGGVQGKVKVFLSELTYNRLAGIVYKDCPFRAVLSWESLTKALLCYQMYDVLEELVNKRVYAAIPPLFEAVVEQTVRSGLDPNKARLALDHLTVETDVITKRFFCRLDDHRTLRLLLMLEEEYRKEHGKPYELPGDERSGGVL